MLVIIIKNNNYYLLLNKLWFHSDKWLKDIQPSVFNLLLKKKLYKGTLYIAHYYCTSLKMDGICKSSESIFKATS